MGLKDDRYTYRVTWSEEDQEYVGLMRRVCQFKLAGTYPRSSLEGHP